MELDRYHVQVGSRVKWFSHGRWSHGTVTSDLDSEGRVEVKVTDTVVTRSVAVGFLVIDDEPITVTEFVIRYSHPTGDGTVSVLAPSENEARAAALSHLIEQRGVEWSGAITWEES